MSDQHTLWSPEPWTRYDGQYGDRRGVVIRNVAGLIAFIPQDAGRQFAEFDAERAKCARLMFSAPDLLALARQYASECGECSGTGLHTIYNYDGHGSDADDQPCPECAEIREAIAKATT